MNHFELTFGDDFVGRFMIGAAIAASGAALASRLVMTLRRRLQAASLRARPAPPHLDPAPGYRVGPGQRPLKLRAGEKAPLSVLAAGAEAEADRAFRRARRRLDIWSALLGALCMLTVGVYARQVQRRVTGVGEISSFGQCKSNDGRWTYACFEATYLAPESAVGLELQSCGGFRWDPQAPPANRLASHDRVLLTSLPGDRDRCVLGSELPLSAGECFLLLIWSGGLLCMCALYQRAPRA